MIVKDLIPQAFEEHAPEPKSGDQNPTAVLLQDMNRVFERFGVRAADLEWPCGGSEARSDVVETGDAVEVSIELRGTAMEVVEVSVSDDLLIVKGDKKVERQEEKEGHYVSERSYGAIFWTIPLPPGIDWEKAEAAIKNGVLTVKLPQIPKAQTKVRRIEVKNGCALGAK